MTEEEQTDRHLTKLDSLLLLSNYYEYSHLYYNKQCTSATWADLSPPRRHRRRVRVLVVLDTAVNNNQRIPVSLPQRRR